MMMKAIAMPDHVTELYRLFLYQATVYLAVTCVPGGTNTLSGMLLSRGRQYTSADLFARHEASPLLPAFSVDIATVC